MKYTIDWAFDCSCYGTTEIEATSEEDAVRQVREMHASELLFTDYEAAPELGMTNERVVLITDENGECVDDGFDFEEGESL
jgi:uncharacterized protein with ATP-grasp and redox domains